MNEDDECDCFIFGNNFFECGRCKRLINEQIKLQIREQKEVDDISEEIRRQVERSKSKKRFFNWQHLECAVGFMVREREM